MKHVSLLFVFVLLTLAGCGADTGIGKKVINRMDVFFYEYPELLYEERENMLDSMRPGVDALFFLIGDSVGYDAYKRYSASPAVRVFSPDVFRLITSLDSIEHVLCSAEKAIGRILPEIRLGDIYSIVSPYNQSVFVVDSVLLIGLNHYLGSEYPGYSTFAKYQRWSKALKYMPYDAIEALVASYYIYKPAQDATVLSRMLYNGALIEAKMQILPNANLADAIGLTESQLEWAQGNSREIWNAMIMKNLIHSTSVSDADRLLMPSPATVIIHPDAPGRIGRYVGYMIVKSYMQRNPEAGLMHILSPEFYNSPSTLIKSGYNGE